MKERIKRWTLLGLMMASAQMIAQNTRYVESIIDFSSDGGTCAWGGGWEASKVIGAPDKFPAYGDDGSKAWAHCAEDDGREYLQLEFDDPAPIDSITIYETYNIGSIDTVYVKNESDVWEIVYTTTAAEIGGSTANALGIAFPLTSFDVSEVRVALSTSIYVGDWSQIDAVAIHGPEIMVDDILVEGEGGVSSISTLGGTLQMEATISPSNATDQSFEWSVVNGTGSAIISSSGILVATGNGTVDVFATAQDGSGVFGSKTINISGQTDGSTSVFLTTADNTIKDAYVFSWSLFEDVNFGEANAFNGGAVDVIRVRTGFWSAEADTIRGLLSFDLSGIPVDATILDAKLSLYYPTDAANVHSGANDLLIQRISENWSETGVTWLNQPIVSTMNEVNLPASTLENEDYPNIEVTSLVQDMIDNPGSDGFLLRMAEEVPSNELIYASTEHPDSFLHPTLLITYAPADLSIESNVDVDIQMFPNPAINTVQIITNELNTEFLIINMQGQVVESGITSESETMVNISELPEGMYLIKFPEIGLQKKLMVLH
ncbi:MAG: DNRLRE domain-containing protein [Crocinitomicaceae bacterium]|nr:DNRLRE domain-containing protein [Crocinitomicaceae bacterium]